MQVLDVRVFQTPRWFQYTIAVASTLTATACRWRMHDTLGGSSPLVIFSFPVAIAAFLGGLGPGLVATALSIVLGTVFFIVPYGKSPFEDLETSWTISAHAAVWLFICIVCDLLRKTALWQRATLTDRDENRERLTSIFDSMSDGFFAVDNEWKITHANEAFAKFVEAPGQDLRGRSLWDSLAHLKDYVQPLFIEAMASRTSAETDIEQPHGARWYHVRLFPDQFGMSGYVHDTTDRKQVEYQNELLLIGEKFARREAEHASQLKDEFIATLSHELRTPLTAILGWSELLNARKDLDPKVSEGLEAIERSTKLQTQLVEELLDMSRISVGKVRLDLAYLDVVEVVQEAVATFVPAADAKGIELTIDCPDEDVLVRGDSSRLLQVFSNLVSNAVKFTPDQGHIHVTVDREDGNARVRVRDDGQGIDPQFQPFLFDRFRQANASITRSHGGLGLGLAIARQLMNLHGGTINATSEGPGCGSEFVVTIPLVEHRRLVKSESADDLTKEPVKLPGLRVLVVDDERETRSLLNAVLREAGASVKTADSARAAMVQLSKFKPEILVSDIGMPETDGYALIRGIRQLSQEDGGKIPAIALTAFAREEDRALAFSAGFHAHLTKPVEQSVLLKTIRYLVANNGASNDVPSEVEGEQQEDGQVREGLGSS